LKSTSLEKTVTNGWKRIAGAVEWRVRSKLGDDVFDAAIFRIGSRFRPFVDGIQFFGIAGSVGKTTAKDLLVSILNVRGKAIGNPLSRNAAPEIARTILRTRPWHRYCVAELGETGPGSLDDHLIVLKPSVGIITVVGDDHLSAFGTRQAIAREFAKLVQSIPAHGTVALNLDDELVSGLCADARGRVITYGTKPGADLHATDIVSTWPDPLQFTVSFNGDSVRIGTQLLGRQLLPSALAAIAGGLAAGLTLAECATGIGRVSPVEGRMQLVQIPGGITFIRDDFKAPAWTVEPLLEQLRDACVNRKIFILGSISDCESKERGVIKIASKAVQVADITILYGRFAVAGLKARKSSTESKVFAFTRIQDVANLLQSILHDNDLILLKGSEKKDHLSRLALSLTQTVNCWVDDCGRDMFCSECSHLQSRRGPPGLINSAIPESDVSAKLSDTLPNVAQTDQIIIGLGNPGAEFAGTPHNIGYESLDALCSSIESKWEEYSTAWIAEGTTEGRKVWLIKVKTPMNLTGATLKKLSEAMNFDAPQCILIFDDIDLPIGKVRTRMNGSSGGHRGVASVLEAFQTYQFRRVKIGVKRSSLSESSASAVLNRFDETEAGKILLSFLEVKKCLSDLVGRS